MINLNYGSWIKVARTLASHSSLSISFVDQDEIDNMGAEAWTDGGRLFVREPAHTWDDATFKLWLYFLIHEIGHNTASRRRIFAIMKEKQPRGLLAYILNVLEDHAQERELYHDNPILRTYLADGREKFMKFQMGRTDDEALESMKKNPQAPTLYAWDTGLRLDFMSTVRGLDYMLLKPIMMEPQVQEWMKRLNAGDYASVLRSGATVEQVFELAERILVEVFEADPKQQQRDPSEGEGKGDAKGKEKGKGKSGAGEGKGKPGDEKGQGAAGEAKPGNGPPGTGGGGTVDYADLLNHNHKMDERSAQKDVTAGGGGLTIDYEGYFANNLGRQDFIPNQNFKVYDLARHQYPPQDNRRSYGAVQGSSLSKRVARFMQANSVNKRLHGQKSGRLSNKNLYRLKVPNMGSARERVFNKRVLNKSKDVAVSLCIDMSGSMDGSKSIAAIAAVTHLHEVLTSLRIPLEVLGFSEIDTARGAHCIVQSFNKQRRTSDVTEDMKRVLPFNGANRDGEFLLWARERLFQKKAARHIMLVLSDGQPRTAGGDIAAFTKQVIEQMETDTRMEIYGLGILTGSVKSFYRHSEVIQHIGELESKLLTVLKNKIINPI